MAAAFFFILSPRSLRRVNQAFVSARSCSRSLQLTRQANVRAVCNRVSSVHTSGSYFFFPDQTCTRDREDQRACRELGRAVDTVLCECKTNRQCMFKHHVHYLFILDHYRTLLIHDGNFLSRIKKTSQNNRPIRWFVSELV